MHEHETTYETGTGPDHAGRLVITGWCICGASTGTVVDLVL